MTLSSPYGAIPRRQVQEEALPQHRHNLVHVTGPKQGSECKRWVVGTHLSAKWQAHAPPGTHFHQFVVPTIDEVRAAAHFLPPRGRRPCGPKRPRLVVHGVLLYTVDPG